jgi:hypothetical protein
MLKISVAKFSIKSRNATNAMGSVSPVTECTYMYGSNFSSRCRVEVFVK